MTMRRASVGLLCLFAVVGCSGATSPAPSTLNSQPTAAITAATSPSLDTPSPASPDGSAGDFGTYAGTTLRPALNELSDAFNGWGTAFNAAARSGASDADKGAYAAAAGRLKAALASAQTALDGAPKLECAAAARDSAAAFLSSVKGGLDPLLTKSSIGLADLVTVGALLQEAATQAPGVASAIQAACR